MNLTVAVPNKVFKFIKMDSSNANIDLRDIKADELDVNSTNARINVENVETKSADISSTNAKISIDGISGEELKVNTTNGKIEVISVDSQEVDLNTTNGTLFIRDIKEKVKEINASTNNGNIAIFLKDVYKPVKAKVKNHFKDMDTSNFSDSLFTNFVTEDGAMIAYTDGFDEGKDSLEITASTYNGTINIQ
ncbi:MAG: DUF4097 family beta strand repeat-containing protein, partial [Gallicola sp.]|nr:DUF4097 family beta strand repeat-containing protein [Gallicola sp.]